MHDVCPVDVCPVDVCPAAHNTSRAHCTHRPLTAGLTRRGTRPVHWQAHRGRPPPHNTIKVDYTQRAMDHSPVMKGLPDAVLARCIGGYVEVGLAEHVVLLPQLLFVHAMHLHERSHACMDGWVGACMRGRSQDRRSYHRFTNRMIPFSMVGCLFST